MVLGVSGGVLKNKDSSIVLFLQEALNSDGFENPKPGVS